MKPALSHDLITLIRQLADQIYRSQSSPQPWELDALLIVLPITLESALPPDTQQDVANDAVFLSEKVLTYRDLPAAKALVQSCNSVFRRLAESDPANAAWQRDLAVSHYKLAYLARDTDDDAGFQRELRECYRVLDQMHARGLHFDPALAQVYQQLAGMFGS